MFTSNLDASRRDLLRSGALGLTGLAAAPLLNACSSGSAGAAAGRKTLAWETGYLSFFFFVVLQETARRESKKRGLGFVGKNANGDSSAQVNDWNSLILQQPRYLISDALDSEVLVPLTRKADTKKIPVGMVDTPLTGGEVDISVTFDNRQSGVMAAEKTAELLKARNGSPRGTVLNAYGSLTAVALRQRKEGFEQTIQSKYPGIKVVSRPQNNDHAQALSVVNTTLREYPDLDAIHLPTDIFLPDAKKAMQSQNRFFKVGDEKHIVLTSIDGSPNAHEWIRAGDLDADIAQDPVAYVQICIEMLEKYSVKGKDVPLGPYQNKKYFWENAAVAKGPSGPIMTIPPYFVTKDNSKDPRHWANIVTDQWGLKETQS
ncbi:sugar ABC transporter substrate-binding protein [Spirillospora sp. NPDC049024]|uniref:sugar ABC transporter substrate-binding protein n=1 Tax=unclassified Actinomadura TaxID=2626254 RepID=UPI0011ECD356|nr:sugar ABC transporter substrate-binding protein [Actinomadura sp. K4S16]